MIRQELMDDLRRSFQAIEELLLDYDNMRIPDEILRFLHSHEDGSPTTGPCDRRFIEALQSAYDDNHRVYGEGI